MRALDRIQVRKGTVVCCFFDCGLGGGDSIVEMPKLVFDNKYERFYTLR